MIDFDSIIRKLADPDDLPVDPDSQLTKEFLQEQVCSIAICGLVLKRVFIGV